MVEAAAVEEEAEGAVAVEEVGGAASREASVWIRLEVTATKTGTFYYRASPSHSNGNGRRSETRCERAIGQSWMPLGR